MSELETYTAPTITPSLSQSTRRRRLPYGLVYRYGVIGVWLIEIAIFGALQPDTFLTLGNAQSILSSQAALLVLALALVPTLMVNEYDLSIASTMTVSATLVGQLNGVDHWNVVLTVVIGIAAALLVGVVNGLLTVYVGVQGIVVTLGMGTLLLGLSIWVSQSLTVGGVSSQLSSVMNHPVFGISAAFYYAAVIAALLWYGYRHTPLGRYMAFTGHNREVARLSGLPVNAIRMAGFVAGGLLAGIAGIITVGVAGGLQPSSLQTLLLPAFAAAFLGSAVFEPGRVNPLGTCVALLFLATGITGLELAGLSSWIEDVFYGAAVIVAVTVSRLAYLQAQRKNLL